MVMIGIGLVEEIGSEVIVGGKEVEVRRGLKKEAEVRIENIIIGDIVLTRISIKTVNVEEAAPLNHPPRPHLPPVSPPQNQQKERETKGKFFKQSKNILDN